jgi:hypothetical protein
MHVAGHRPKAYIKHSALAAPYHATDIIFRREHSTFCHVAKAPQAGINDFQLSYSVEKLLLPGLILH